jgi:hypothetical protein
MSATTSIFFEQLLPSELQALVLAISADDHPRMLLPLLLVNRRFNSWYASLNLIVLIVLSFIF